MARRKRVANEIEEQQAQTLLALDDKVAAEKPKVQQRKRTSKAGLGHWELLNPENDLTEDGSVPEEKRKLIEVQFSKDYKPTSRPVSLPESKVYIVTAAQMDTRVFSEFHESLEFYAKHRKAELLSIPIPRTPTLGYGIDASIKTPEAMLLLGREYALNRNIRITQDFLPAQNQKFSPAIGRFTQSDSTTIIGHTKQNMQLFPNSSKDLPHVLISTGAVTHPNYLRTQPGMIAQRDHVFGAIVVEVVDDKYFHFRPIRAFGDGSNAGAFVDMGMEWHGDEDPKKAPLEAIVLGDLHFGDTSDKALEASFEMIDRFKPRHIILHDVLNGHSVNHHEIGKILEEAKRYRDNRWSLKEELEDVYKGLCDLAKIAPYAQIHIASSNHHDFITKYINSTNLKDPANFVELAKISLKYVEEDADPLQAGLEFIGKLPKNISFMPRDKDLKILGFELGAHGDRGGNGRRNPSIIEREKIFGKSITAHSHSPGILRDTYVAGTLTELQVSYNIGDRSSWLNTNALLWNQGRGPGNRERGKVQLVNIIDGEWHL